MARERREVLYEDKAGTLRFELVTKPNMMGPGIACRLFEWHKAPEVEWAGALTSGQYVIGTQKNARCTQANIDRLHKGSRHTAEERIAQRLSALIAEAGQATNTADRE